MFRTLAIAAALALPAEHTSAGPVPPEIARACADKWGSDYSMQVYCRDKQMEAYNKLAEQDETASVEPADANETKHGTFGYASTVRDGVAAANRVMYRKGLSGLNSAVEKCYSGIKNTDNLAYCMALDYRAASLGAKTGRNSSKSTVDRFYAFATYRMSRKEAEVFVTQVINVASDAMRSS